MKIFIIIYALISATVILDCLIRPYGSYEFQWFTYWGPFSALIGAAYILANQLKPKLKQAAVLGLFFIISSHMASIVSSKNKVFIAEFDGTITDHYIGGHAMPSIKVKDSTGVIYTVQGVDEKSWKLIALGQHITKQNGSLEISTQKQVAILSKHASISKNETNKNIEQKSQ